MDASGGSNSDRNVKPGKAAAFFFFFQGMNFQYVSLHENLLKMWSEDE